MILHAVSGQSISQKHHTSIQETDVAFQYNTGAKPVICTKPYDITRVNWTQSGHSLSFSYGFIGLLCPYVVSK